MIADGGIRFSGDISKAICRRRQCGDARRSVRRYEEAPGETVLYQGRSYKAYRGMGSLGAMKQGAADRYFQDSDANVEKLVPEGIEGRVPTRARSVR